MITRNIYKRLELKKQEHSEGVFIIRLFSPLNIYLEEYYDRRLPSSNLGYVRIFGKGLRELYFPIIHIETMDINFFKTLVIQEMETLPKLN